jgi:hypothetical protein
MVWRKWLVRSVVFAVLGGLSAAGLLYQRLTSPAAIRDQIVARLQELLPGANITLDSAQLSLLGGIQIQALRLSRRDDPDRKELANLPSAIFWHDKEQILEQKFQLRRIELNRPHLHLTRGKDGRWNLSGDIFSAPHPEIAIPTIVVKDATIIIEDYLPSPGPPALAIKVGYAQAINDPITTVTFCLKGISELAGALELRGTWRRDTGELSLSLHAPQINIGPALNAVLLAYQPKLSGHAQAFEGRAKVQANLFYQPASEQPWRHDITCQISDGKLRHAQVPLPADRIEAVLHCEDGELRLKQMTARLGGTAHVAMTGFSRLDEAPAGSIPRSPVLEKLTPTQPSIFPEQMECAGDLRIEGLVLTNELFAGLPPSLQDLNREYVPRGLVNLDVHFEQHLGECVRRCCVKAIDVSATYHLFRYRLDHIVGDFNHVIDTKEHLHRLSMELTGKTGAQPVTIVGEVLGQGATAHVDINIAGKNIVMDQRLKEALPNGLDKVADSFQPSGYVDFVAKIWRDRDKRQPDKAEWLNQYTLNFHDASLRYDAFPYRLENVRGTLVVLPHGSWEFHDFQGTHKGGTFRVRGRSDPIPSPNPDDKEDWLRVEIIGANARLDEDMDEALEKSHNGELAGAWKHFHPRGTIDFQANVTRRGTKEKAPEVDVTAQARACTIKPDYFPYELTDLEGKFRYTQRQVFVDDVRARHGTTRMTLDRAKVVLKADGGVHLDMTHLGGGAVVLNDEMQVALQKAPGLKSVCDVLQLKEPFGLELDRFVMDSSASNDGSPYFYWDGRIALQGAVVRAGIPVENLHGTAACRGQYSERHLAALNGSLDFSTATVLNQPFRKIQGQVTIPKDMPNTLAFEGLGAEVHGGKVYGTAAVEFGGPIHYDLRLTASQIKLEDFARTNLAPSAPLNGLATAELYLQGRGDEIQNLTGNGRIDIPSGRLYNLPAFLGLLKIIDLRPPSNSFFDEAHAQFAIYGTTVKISRLDLYGNPLSLRGQGDMSLHGTDIHLDFYAVWARIMDYLPPIIKEFPPLISQNLLKIKVRGKLGDLKCFQEPVPMVVDPVKDLWQRTLKGRIRNN